MKFYVTYDIKLVKYVICNILGVVMTVKELISKLKEFPDDMEVMDTMYMDIENVYEGTWTHMNYPYDKPNKQVVIID